MKHRRNWDFRQGFTHLVINPYHSSLTLPSAFRAVINNGPFSQDCVETHSLSVGPHWLKVYRAGTVVLVIVVENLKTSLTVKGLGYPQICRVVFNSPLISLLPNESAWL